jgi:hypothetical protein
MNNSKLNILTYAIIYFYETEQLNNDARRGKISHDLKVHLLCLINCFSASLLRSVLLHAMSGDELLDTRRIHHRGGFSGSFVFIFMCFITPVLINIWFSGSCRWGNCILNKRLSGVGDKFHASSWVHTINSKGYDSSFFQSYAYIHKLK